MKKSILSSSLLTLSLVFLIQLTGCDDHQTSSAKQITSFVIDGMNLSVPGVISQSAFTISVTVPFGTAVNALFPIMTITGSSVSPDNGLVQDFTNPVTYTVTAADGSKQTYVVTVNMSPNPTRQITAFDFDRLNPPVAGVISQSGFTIDLAVPYGTAVTALVPAITYTGKTISPASGVPQNFTNPVTYAVTAADGSTQGYVVTVIVEPMAWTSGGPTGEYVRAVVVNGTNIFAGTSGDGIFRSANNGASWAAVNSGLTNTNILTMTENGGNIFAGTSAGLFVSANSGTSWTSLGLTNDQVYSIGVNGSTIFAGTYDDGIYLSSNNGATWTSAGLPGEDVVTIAFSGSNIFAGTDGSGVYLSTNNGASWTGVSSGLTDLEVYSLAVSGNNIFAGTWRSGVFLSTDNGATWTSSGLTDQNVHSFAISGNKIYAGVINGGVFVSADQGGTWTAMNTGLTSLTVISLAVGNGNIFSGTQGYGVFTVPL